jgi:integrase
MAQLKEEVDDRVLEASELAIRHAKAIGGRRTTYRIKSRQKDALTGKWVWVIERGLELRVSPSGAATWCFTYWSKIDQKAKRYVIGHRDSIDPSQAVKEAAKLRNAAQEGDPHAEREARKAEQARAGLTFNTLADEWLEKHATPNKKASSVYEDNLMLAKDIRPVIGTTPAEKVTKAEIIQLVNTVAKRAGVRSNRVLALARSIYRWGLSEDLITVDPTYGVKPRTKEKERDRELNWQEIRTFWNALDGAMSPQIALAVRLALVTGQRIGEEIAQAEIAEFDLEGQAAAWQGSGPVWTIPAERAKNDEGHRVPLSPLAVQLVREAIALAGDSPYLFPSPAGDGPIDAHAPTRAMSRARGDDERTKPLKPRKSKYKRRYKVKPRPPKPGLGVKNVRIHDLRRTVASRMAELGVSESVVSRVLNHKSAFKGNITGKVYNKYGYDREKRQALDLWASKLELLLSDQDASPDSNVIPMPARA